MIRIESKDIFSRMVHGLLILGVTSTLVAFPGRTRAQQKAEAKQEKKAEAKPQAASAGTDDPAKLKAQLVTLQQEVAQLKLKVATLELEKLGASVNVDKGKDGKEVATVNILQKWTGDKDAMQLLKNVPNLQVVYIDSKQVNDAALAPLKDLAGLSALTIMSPQVTDAALENVKSLNGLTMLFLTSSKVSDKGLVQLVDCLGSNLRPDQVERLQAFDILEGIEAGIGNFGSTKCQNLEVLEAFELNQAFIADL